MEPRGRRSPLVPVIHAGMVAVAVVKRTKWGCQVSFYLVVVDHRISQQLRGHYATCGWKKSVSTFN